MPRTLPSVFQGEWGLVTFSMTASALANLAFEYPRTRESALKAVARMVPLMQRAEFKVSEVKMWRDDPLSCLAGDHGHAGYLGHLGVVLSAHRFLGGDGRFDDLHHRIVGALARRLESRAAPLLETYPKEIYVPDNVVVLAVIGLHDRIFKSDHRALIARWVRHARTQLVDGETGVLRFWADAEGKGRGHSRGSGAGWNSFFLPFFSRELAAEQYRQTRAAFLKRLPFGLAAMREYPPGVSGRGDVDSGPVVFGLSPSGTGFIIAGARHARDEESLRGLLWTAELAGSTIAWRGARRYLFAPLVGDAILLAMLSARDWGDQLVRR
jgi:hypothetical protein